jgi:7-carboxy-7-deazaguanine synthase
MTSKISEIFSSIQGEGPYAGVRQVFVRFFQCHMHCVWCDTPDSIGDGKREFKEFTVEQLWREVKPLTDACHSVSLTGGEPLMQADFIKKFIPTIKKARLKVYLETSGVLHKELKKIISGVDIVSMDMKLPSSTQQRAFWKEHEEFLKVAKKKEVFIKAVITSQTKFEDVKRAAAIVKRVTPKAMFILQPNTFDLKAGVVDKCAEFHKYCLRSLPNARILPQMHKFINVR